MWAIRLFVCFVLICFAACPCEAQTTASATRPSVNLLAMGDWGTHATTQRSVASALSTYVKNSQRRFDGMLLLGDNVYLKPGQLTAELWQSMFEQTYDRQSLSFPFYAALGNHDYAGKTVDFQLQYARENPQSRWKMPAKWYRVDLPADKPLVTVLVLDSVKDAMTPQDWATQLGWIEGQLTRPRGRWTMMTAHHSPFSNGEHGDVGPLQPEWGPLMKKYNVDFYVAGHDHDLQHLEIDGWKTSFILAGGGGAAVRPIRNDKRGPFSKSTYGFADFQFAEQSAKCRIVSRDGKVIHEFTRAPDGAVTVNFTTPSDVAVPRTPKSINRPDLPATRPAAAAVAQ
jgi:hypothetical protein